MVLSFFVLPGPADEYSLTSNTYLTIIALLVLVQVIVIKLLSTLIIGVIRSGSMME